MAPVCPNPIQYHIPLPEHVEIDERIDTNDEMLCLVLDSIQNLTSVDRFRVRMRFFREHLIFWSVGNPAAHLVGNFDDISNVCDFIEEFCWKCNCLPGRVEPMDRNLLCTLCS